MKLSSEDLEQGRLMLPPDMHLIVFLNGTRLHAPGKLFSVDTEEGRIEMLKVFDNGSSIIHTYRGEIRLVIGYLEQHP